MVIKRMASLTGTIDVDQGLRKTGNHGAGPTASAISSARTASVQCAEAA